MNKHKKFIKLALIPLFFLLTSCAGQHAKKAGGMASNDCVSTSPTADVGKGMANLAQNGQASQSSTYFFKWNATADLAIDGDANGDYFGHSLSHTQADQNAWWRVDLDSDHELIRIVVWNRTDHGLGKRLSNFNVSIQDSKNKQVWQQNYCSGGKWFQPAMIVDLPKGLKGKTVLIKLNGRNYLQLAEVQVFGI